MPLAINLVNSYITSYSFHALPEVTLDDLSPVVVPPSLLQFKIESGSSDDLEDHLLVVLNCSLQDDLEGEEIPYDFEIELTGIFAIDDEFAAAIKDPSEGDWIILEAAVSHLYATAREYVATTTARGPYPMLLLPTVDFGEMSTKDEEGDGDEEEVEEEKVPSPAKRKRNTTRNTVQGTTRNTPQGASGKPAPEPAKKSAVKTSRKPSGKPAKKPAKKVPGK